MTFGTSNRVALRFIEEVTWGDTPATPALQALRFTSESVNNNADFITSDEIRSDRMTPDTVQTGLSAGGDINAELSFATYDTLMEGAMFEDFATTGTVVGPATDISTTKTGGSPNTWTIDTAAEDFTSHSLTVGQFIKVTGFAVAGTFIAEITSIATLSMGIKPLTDIATEGAGDAVTITPLDFLRNGITNKSYTVQKVFTDLDTPELWNFTGARIGTWGLDLATGSILTMTFGLLAKDGVMTETQFSGASIIPANTNDVMNAVNDVSAITFDGDPGAQQFFFNNLSISIDNALRGQEAVGTLGFVGVEPGRLSVTGSFEIYFEDSTTFDNFRAATAFQLTFQVEDASGQAYIFTFPRCKYTSMEIVAGGLDQDIFANSEFEALINSAGTYQMQITRIP